VSDPRGVETQETPELDEFGRAYGTGRRKTSIARVWVKKGSGIIIVNDKRFTDYFQPNQKEHILAAFMASGSCGLFDVWCTVKGGGMSGKCPDFTFIRTKRISTWHEFNV